MERKPLDFDLHTHTLCSDGRTTPTDNVRLAAAAGLAGLALTDHDTFDGWAEGSAAAAQLGVELIPGVELSTEVDGLSLHLLGYWVDPEHPALAAECRRLRVERDRRAEATVARLAELGVDIALARVRAIAGAAPVGRPHIAAAMVEAGAVADSAAAFDDYLADGGPAYVPKRALAPAAGVALIVAAGGVAVLAHPGLGSREAQVTGALLDEMVGAGLAGVEADHPGHDPQVRVRWRRIAAARELEITGSSDFHGDLDHGRIGERTTPAAVVARLRAKMCANPSAMTEEAPWPGQRSD